MIKITAMRSARYLSCGNIQRFTAPLTNRDVPDPLCATPYSRRGCPQRRLYQLSHPPVGQLYHLLQSNRATVPLVAIQSGNRTTFLNPTGQLYHLSQSNRAIVPLVARSIIHFTSPACVSHRTFCFPQNQQCRPFSAIRGGLSVRSLHWHCCCFAADGL